MSAAATFDAAAIRSASPIAELRERQPALAAAGFAFLALFAVASALQLFDGRTLDGVSVWTKPAKFFLSTGVFLLTSAWFFGYVRPDRRDAPALRWSVRIVIAAGVFELGYITLQAGLGERSHFNRADAAHFWLYGAMGAAALTMLLTKIPLALEIWRRPVRGLDPTLRLAVVAGIALTVVLGALSGLYMSQQYGAGHNVGAVGGATPLFGWNRAGGDLRVAHFFGMHGEQLLPVVAALTTGAFGALGSRRLVIAAGVAIAAITVAVFAQAVMGQAFPLG
ncbi:hypothetical protein [Chenggangzhangella methanolivorans]|uniref:Uncharacterized protein n=1 Tax=Chenggangzhangella methanolivorans TaxID=1437009 RepID=A0A9E6R992_9HYPH|nr:hypothetical protein [Chenggangzhangella methanolivorans]QZN99168.1 hypothetical protein K6K41_20370 [Chenggangzhangella methanolivorans]